MVYRTNKKQAEKVAQEAHAEETPAPPTNIFFILFLHLFVIIIILADFSLNVHRKVIKRNYCQVTRRHYK